jgi:hypothetical protein
MLPVPQYDHPVLVIKPEGFVEQYETPNNLFFLIKKGSEKDQTYLF